MSYTFDETQVYQLWYHDVVIPWLVYLCFISGTIICSSVAYPVHGNPVSCFKLSHEDVGSQYDLIGTVHHKARKRGNSRHYTAVCKS